ncbi:MAG: hypothetical protein HC822_15900 [Oscillochloris sp.]|nr:hypothetical protein [Oscillochloris sp.]
MTPLFKKLNLKAESPLLIVAAPPSFGPELAALERDDILHDPAAAATIPFLLAFVTTLPEIEALVSIIAAQAPGDPLIWFAYPKARSKTYRCEFNRDTGWAALGTLGFEPVRQVAIDADWSALRFRRVAFIKSLTRDPTRRLTSDADSPPA